MRVTRRPQSGRPSVYTRAIRDGLDPPDGLALEVVNNATADTLALDRSATKGQRFWYCLFADWGSSATANGDCFVYLFGVTSGLIYAVGLAGQGAATGEFIAPISERLQIRYVNNSGSLHRMAGELHPLN